MKISLNTFQALFVMLLKKEIDYYKIIFSSSNNADFDYNSRYLFEYMLQNYKGIKCRYVINDDIKRARLEETYGNVFIETRSTDGILEALSAGAWVTSAGLPVYLPFAGRKRFIMNLWHGMCPKGIGLRTGEVSTIKRPFYKLLFSNNYSAISSTSALFRNVMAMSFEVDEEKVVCLGQPRNDQLWNSNDRYRIVKALAGLDLDEGAKLVLYAPTWRDKESTRFFPFADFNRQELQKVLKLQNVYILIKYHKSETGRFNEKDMPNVKIIDNSAVDDIMSIINIFDLLITDYSSIYIDYLILKKPIIFLPYDKQEFEKMRGFNFDYDSHAPGPKPNTQKEFCRELFRLLDDPSYYYNERIRVNELFNTVTEDSCRLNAEYIIKRLESLKAHGRHVTNLTQEV